jgi:DNA repair photolyase
MLLQKQIKSVLNKNTNLDSRKLDDYTVNTYEGYNRNCLYCFVSACKYGVGFYTICT